MDSWHKGQVRMHQQLAEDEAEAGRPAHPFIIIHAILQLFQVTLTGHVHTCKCCRHPNRCWIMFFEAQAVQNEVCRVSSCCLSETNRCGTQGLRERTGCAQGDLGDLAIHNALLR